MLCSEAPSFTGGVSYDNSMASLRGVAYCGPKPKSRVGGGQIAQGAGADKILQIAARIYPSCIGILSFTF
jgi:hypothetical protein